MKLNNFLFLYFETCFAILFELYIMFELIDTRDKPQEENLLTNFIDCRFKVTP